MNGEVKDVVNQSNPAKLLAIYTTIMQQQQKQSQLPNCSVTSPVSTTDLVQEVILLLQEEVRLLNFHL